MMHWMSQSDVTRTTGQKEHFMELLWSQMTFPQVHVSGSVDQ